MPQFETMMIVCLRWSTEGIASSNPEVGEKSLMNILIAKGSEQGCLIRKSTITISFAIVAIMRKNHFRTKIKSHQRPLNIIIKKELMTISHGVSFGIIVVLITPRTYETRTKLPTLTYVGKSSFIRQLRTATKPRQKRNLKRVLIIFLQQRCWRLSRKTNIDKYKR